MYENDSVVSANRFYSGDFIMDLGGKIYYHDETLAGNLDNSSPNVVVEDEVRPDGITILKDGSGVKIANGDFIPAVTEADFTLGAKVAGYYSYTGSEKKVYIPSDLKLGGNLITDASYMFNGSSVEKVVLLENNITNMSFMFANSKATTLDLSSFNTSKVTNMIRMFWSSKATTLYLSSFDTSKVTDMHYMFSESQATSLDLSSFDTSNVTDMYMSTMFRASEATTGYAKTKADADKLNGATTMKPEALTFTVKQ